MLTMIPLLFLANILIPVAVIVFATGFFPYKPFIPGLASHDDLSEYGAPPKAQFDRLVFMVVDALRSDFVFSSGSGFSYTQKLIRDGDGFPFTAYSTPPTITMPRIKAITTGSVPSFVDAILNFAESDTTSTLASVDSWLMQIKANNRNNRSGGEGRLIMYGDDTWLKVFPGMFARADGTSSFFVSDFTEVDQNVTRHVPVELQNDDWDAMIMHYLGLDHIGHKAGPTSPNMTPKHMEMDAVVRSIFGAISKLPHLNSTLFIMCGDHGMNEGGNHGGAGPGETSTALLFMSPKLRTLSPSGRKCPVTPRGQYEFYNMVDQSDMAPTISSLLGLPIPRNNVGVILPEFLALWDDPNEQQQLLLRNALQILSIVKASFSNVDFDSIDDSTGCDRPSSDAGKLACQWKTTLRLVRDFQSNGGDVKPSLNALFDFCKAAQEVMSGAASNYDVPRMSIGIGIQTISFVIASIYALTSIQIGKFDFSLIAGITGAYGIMMFASSYVEEEQQFWYWLAAGWLYLIGIASHQKSEAEGNKVSVPVYISTWTLAICQRLIQRWNQTGQKHAGAPDIVSSVLNEHPFYFWCLVGFAYFVVTLRASSCLSSSLGIPTFITFLLTLSASVPSLLLKIGFTAADAPELFFWLQGEQVLQLQDLPLIKLARIVFTVLFCLFSLTVLLKARSSKARSAFLSTTHALFTIFLMTQSRAANTPVFLLSVLQYLALDYLNMSIPQASVTSLILGHVAFFALGNSNAMSSIDLSNAYNGVSGYNIVAVGVLLFFGNWAGPMWWGLGALALISRHQNFESKGAEKQEKRESKDVKDPFLTHASIWTLFISGSTLAVMVACTMMRTHLFIWTVFSPKYLFIMAWSMGFHILFTMGLGRGLWALSTW